MTNDHEPDPHDELGQRGFMPWILVMVAVLVVGAIVLANRIDPDEADAAGPAVSEPAQPSGEASTEGAATSGEAADEPARTPNACPGYTLGTNVFTRPLAADQPGIHIWHDIEGFHVLLVPGDGSVDRVEGTVTATGVPLTLESEPPVADRNGDTITFALDEAQPELRFKRDCETTAITFDLKSDGQPVTPDMVTVGTGQTPDTIPVVVTQLDP